MPGPESAVRNPEAQTAPRVSVTRAIILDGEVCLATPEGNWERSGKECPEDYKYVNLLNRSFTESAEMYFLQWSGNRMPVGAEIGGEKIGWVQGGSVHLIDGRPFGRYERLTSGGGQLNEMVIVANPKPRIIKRLG